MLITSTLYIGYCSASDDAAPMMILELMQYGDLESFLLSNRYFETPRCSGSSNIVVTGSAVKAKIIIILLVNKLLNEVARDLSNKKTLK